MSMILSNTFLYNIILNFQNLIIFIFRFNWHFFTFTFLLIFNVFIRSSRTSIQPMQVLIQTSVVALFIFFYHLIKFIFFELLRLLLYFWTTWRIRLWVFTRGRTAETITCTDLIIFFFLFLIFEIIFIIHMIIFTEFNFSNRRIPWSERAKRWRHFLLIDFWIVIDVLLLILDWFLYLINTKGASRSYFESQGSLGVCIAVLLIHLNVFDVWWNICGLLFNTLNQEVEISFQSLFHIFKMSVFENIMFNKA